MSNTRNLADLLDSGGDIKSAALDNVPATDISGKLNLSGGTLTGTLTMESTDAGNSAAPELILYRNSASPANGDYLGQVQFKGENANGAQEIYAKVTGKISDPTHNSEDGLIETAIKGDGSFTIVSRQKSDELQLLNGVNLDVDGSVTATGYTGSGANLTSLPAAQLTGALPAISGANLTNLTSTFNGLTDTTVSTSDPATNANPSATGHIWVNKSSGETYVCTDNTTNQNNWINIGEGTGNVKYFTPITSLLMLGGGGQGGGNLRGGGGHGGLLYFTGFKYNLDYGTQYTITVGAGGSGATGNANGGNGGSSTAFGETAGGGTGGGAGTNTYGGGDGGSSSTASPSSGYTTKLNRSNTGGVNSGNPGAGGAGAGANGETLPGGNRAGGAGGVGYQIANIYNGSDNFYWGGGGGGCGYDNTENGGAGGLGGGGGGGVFSEGSPSGTLGPGGGSALDTGDTGGNGNNAENGGDGGTNTGAGGGSGSHTGGGQTSSSGGPGGSGIVCIKIPDSETAATTTGTVVTTTTGGYRYYAFTSSGTITFNG